MTRWCCFRQYKISEDANITEQFHLRTRAFNTINVTVDWITMHQRIDMEQPCINYIASIALKKPLIVRLFKHM